MMKILGAPLALGLNDTHNYYGGAIGNISYNLVRSLSRFGMEIRGIICGADLVNPLPDNVKLYRVGNPEDGLLGYNIRLNRYAEKIIKKEKIDIITQLYFTYGVSFSPVLNRLKDYPFVLGMCELPHPVFEDESEGITRNPLIKYLAKKAIFPFFKKTIDYCDTLIAVNDAARNLYGGLMPKRKIKVIPYGVDSAYFRYSKPPNRHNILVISRLIRRRGIDYLIEAMEAILKEYPDAHLYIVGEGPRKKKLYGLAKITGGLPNIVFHGRASPQELLDFYRNCDVFCHMSYADGSNLTALEAMATGRPVVCTDAPHNSMVMDGETGYKVPFGDSDATAERIMCLFADNLKAEKMGLEGRKRVEKYHDWDSIGKEYYEVYRNSYDNV